MEKVSVIIPVYNAERFLTKCIHSIINQTYKNIEIIIIDDGSTDNSIEICEDLAKKDRRIKIIREKHKGVSNARNKGIEVSTGVYILFVDSDDWIQENLIEENIKVYNRFYTDIVIYNYNKVYNNKKKSHINLKEGKYELNKIIYELVLFEELNSPWNKMYKRNIIYNHNIIFDKDTTIGEDLLFNIEYFKHIKNVYITEKLLYNYNIHHNSSTRKFNKNKYIQLSNIHRKLSDWLNNIEFPQRAELIKYIKFKNIISCILDLRKKECYYSKQEKINFLSKIKKENPQIFVYNISLKILICSYIYSILSPELLKFIMWI